MAIAIIVLLPVLYVASSLGSLFGDSESGKFHGYVVREIEASKGSIDLPLPDKVKQGAALHGQLNATFLDSLTGVTSPDSTGLALDIIKVNTRATDCANDPAVNARAPFVVQSTCAAQDFEALKASTKTALFVDADLQLIVFGDSASNISRVTYGNWIATFHSPPMTQGDLKRQACQAKIMIDYMLMIDKNPPATCAK